VLLDDVPRHGYVERSLVVIPFELNPAVEIAVPIYGEFIFFLDARNEVVNVLLTFIFYTKIINNQREGDGPVGVIQKTGGLFTLEVSIWSEEFLEELVCKDAGLGEAPHCSLHFQIYVPIKDLVCQHVLLNNPGGGRGKGMCMYSYWSKDLPVDHGHHKVFIVNVTYGLGSQFLGNEMSLRQEVFNQELVDSLLADKATVAYGYSVGPSWGHGKRYELCVYWRLS
jgi:hypothetical protein